MRRRDLPLNALRAFEAVARNQSFTAAAQELLVSQGAISQHVRQLEERLSCQLVLRNRTPIALTAEGVILLDATRQSLDSIEAAVSRVAPDNSSPTLRFNVLPTFGISWLLPIISKFKLVEPAVVAEIATGLHEVDLHTAPFDFSMSIGQPDPDEFWFTPILDGQMLPVVSPRVWRKELRFDEALMLAGVLYSENRKDDWPNWCKVAGHASPSLDKATAFGFSFLMYQAAINGLGVAIAARGFVENELASGVLVPASPVVLQTRDLYYLKCKRSTLRRLSARAFTDWMQVHQRVDAKATE